MSCNNRGGSSAVHSLRLVIVVKETSGIYRVGTPRLFALLAMALMIMVLPLNAQASSLKVNAITPSVTPKLDPGQSIVLGGSATGGISPYKYQWYFSAGSLSASTCTSSGTPIAGANATAYTASPNSSALYYCYSVTDSANTVKSSAGRHIALKNSPLIYLQPLSVSIDGGQQALLTAKVDNGTGVFSWQWYNSSGAIANANGILKKANYSSSLAGNYYVVFTDTGTSPNATPVISVRSANATVSINPRLSISISPSNSVGLDVGQSQAFNATASGGSGNYIFYKWYNSSSCTGTAHKTQSFATKALSSAGTYSYCVEVEDSLHTVVNRTATITVNPPPNAGAPTASNSVMDGGGETTLSSTPSNGTPPYSYQWYSSTDGSCSASSNQIAGATSPTYNAYPESNTLYCYSLSDSASPPLNALSGNVAITVYPALTLLLSATNTVVDNGQQTTLHAQAQGGTGNYIYNYYQSGCSTPLSGNTVEPSSTATYCAVVSDGLGSASNTITIRVNQDPTVSISASGANVVDQGQILPTLSANVDYSGSGVVSVSWFASNTLPCGATTQVSNGLSYQPPNSIGTVYYCAQVLDSNLPGYASPTSNAIGITVNRALDVSMSPSSNSVRVGQTIGFTNTTQYGTPPYSFSALSTNAPYGWYSISGNTIAFNAIGTFNVTMSVSDSAGSNVVGVSTVTVESLVSGSSANVAMNVNSGITANFIFESSNAVVSFTPSNSATIGIFISNITSVTNTLPSSSGFTFAAGPTLQLNMTGASNSITNVTVSLQYNCSNGGSVAPYILTNGTWSRINNFTVNSTSCTVLFSIPVDPTFGIFYRSAVPLSSGGGGGGGGGPVANSGGLPGRPPTTSTIATTTIVQQAVPAPQNKTNSSQNTPASVTPQVANAITAIQNTTAASTTTITQAGRATPVSQAGNTVLYIVVAAAITIIIIILFTKRKGTRGR